MDGVQVETLRGSFRLTFPRTIFAKPIRENFLGASPLRKDPRGFWGFNMPASPHAFLLVEQYFKGNGIPFRLDLPAQRILQYFYRKREFDPNYLTIEDPNPLHEPAIVLPDGLWDHQKRAFWFAVDRLGGLHKDARGGALLGLSMGLGKTYVAILLILNYQWKRVLVFCPQKVIPVWPSEFKKHAGEFGNYRVIPLTGPTTKRAEELRKYDQFDYPQVYVTNYEALDRPKFKESIEKIAWDACILDEGHRIKDPRGKRSKFLGKLADQVPCRLELTGTPNPNDPLDIFAQARFLDRSYFGLSYTFFRSEYAILGPLPGTNRMVQVLGYKNEKDLARKVFHFCLQVDADEVQDLPEEHHVTVPVELRESRRYYDQMDEEFTVAIENDDITAANVLVKIGKLQEITGGFLRNPETQQVTQIGTEKREALKEKLEDLPTNDPVVIFCRLRPDLDNIAGICDEIGRPHFEVSGRRNELEDWQLSTGNEILICQISAGKEGVDLTRSRWAFYYSLGYQPGEFEQSKKRQHRPGQQAKRVTYFHLIASNTRDEQIYRAIRNKQRVIDVVRNLSRQNLWIHA